MIKSKNNKQITKDEFGTIKTIVYIDEHTRKIYHENRANKSNYKTITKEIRREKDFMACSRLEIGEKYVTYYRFDERGVPVFERRYNKVIGSLNVKEVISDTENGSVTLNTHNKEKSINFKLKNKKTTNGKRDKKQTRI